MDEGGTLSDWVSAHRRAVSTCAALILVIICTLRILVLGEWDAKGHFQYVGFARNIVDGLLSTVAVSFAIATFVWWLRAPLRNTPAAGEIPPYSIGASLNAAAKTALEWEYCGHIGRDARCRVLRALGARSKADAIAISIRFTILDPTDAPLCTAYADYRSRSRSSTLSPVVWDCAAVQADVLATTVCLIKAKAEFPQLRIQLGFSSHFGLWRFDRSNQVVIMTQEEPQQPAYRYKIGSRFFAYHRQECEEIWLQSVQHIVAPRHAPPLDDTALIDELKRLLGRSARTLEPLFPQALDLAAQGTFYA